MPTSMSVVLIPGSAVLTRPGRRRWVPTADTPVAFMRSFAMDPSGLQAAVSISAFGERLELVGVVKSRVSTEGAELIVSAAIQCHQSLISGNTALINLPTVLKSARRSSCRASTLLILAVTCFIASGCGEQRAAPVNVELARSTLLEVLEHWKKGGMIDELRQRSPEIVVQEALWSGGQKLQDFELVDDGRALDANWFCDVELTLAPENGGEPTKKTFTYAIGTDPVLTVFRAML